MTVRRAALRWLAAAHRVRDGDIAVSRFYPAGESWTGRAAWWLQLPVHRIIAPGERDFHLLCEAAPGANAFHYLRVPARWLRAHLDELDRPGDGRTADLFLSAEPATRFHDTRGAGALDLAPFLVPPAG